MMEDESKIAFNRESAMTNKYGIAVNNISEKQESLKRPITEVSNPQKRQNPFAKKKEEPVLEVRESEPDLTEVNHVS